MSIVATLDVPIRGETSSIDKALEKTAKKVQTWSEYIKSMSEGTRLALSAATGGLSEVTASVINWSSSIKSVWTSLKDMAKSGAEGINALAKSSAILGISVRALGGLEYASGLDIDTLTNNLDKLQRHMGEAAEGGIPFRQALHGIGLDFNDLRNQPLDKVITNIADAFVKCDNAAQKAHLATVLFGKSGIEMKALLAKGGEGIRKLMQDATELGFAVSGESAASVRAGAKAWKEYQQALTGIGRSFAVIVAPIIEVTNRTFAQAGQFVARFVADNVPLMRQFTETIAAVGKAVREMAWAMLGAFRDAFQVISDKLGLKQIWEDFRDGVLSALFAVQFGAENWRQVLDLACDGVQLAFIKLARLASEALDNLALEVVRAFNTIGNEMGFSIDDVKSFASNMAKIVAFAANPWATFGEVVKASLGMAGTSMQGWQLLMAKMQNVQMPDVDMKLAPRVDREVKGFEAMLAERIKGHGAGELEKALEARFREKGDKAKEDLAAFINRKLGEFKKKVADRNAPDPDIVPGEIKSDQFGKVGAYEKGSKEAFSVLYGTQSAQQKALNTANAILASSKEAKVVLMAIAAALGRPIVLKKGRV